MSSKTVPTKRFASSIRTVIEFATTRLGFDVARLSKQKNPSSSHEKGVEHDHVIILGVSPYGSVGMQFNYNDVPETVSFTYFDKNSDKDIETSKEYDLEEFRQLINTFIKALPKIDYQNRELGQKQFIIAWVKTFGVVDFDLDAESASIKSDLDKLYKKHIPAMKDAYSRVEELDRRYKNASDLVNETIENSDVYQRVLRLREELGRAKEELSQYRKELTKEHALEELDKCKQHAIEKYDGLDAEYQTLGQETISKYHPLSVMRYSYLVGK